MGTILFDVPRQDAQSQQKLYRPNKIRSRAIRVVVLPKFSCPLWVKSRRRGTLRVIPLSATSGHWLMANLQFVTLPDATVAGPKSRNSLGVHQLRG